MSCELTLKNGKGIVALIDEEDMERVSSRPWWVKGHTRRVYTTIKGKNVYLHRFIMNAPKGIEVDHINHNPLDNRKSNLRFATRSQNEQNKPPDVVGGRSGHRNVYWVEANQKYRVLLMLNKRNIHFGYFSNLDEAAAVARRARQQVFTHATEPGDAVQ